MISLNSLIHALIANIPFSYHEYEGDKCMLYSDNQIENSQFEQCVVQHCTNNNLIAVKKVSDLAYNPYEVDVIVYNGEKHIGQVHISNYTGRKRGLGPSWAIVSISTR